MKKLFDMTVFQKNDIDIGRTCCGDTLISPNDEGVFSGEELSGQLIPVGMGVTYTPYPGMNDIVSSMILKTDDGAEILMEFNAHFDIDPDVEERLADGGDVSPDDYYFKGVATFKTSHEKYRWIERKICVCEFAVVNWEQISMGVYLV